MCIAKAHFNPNLVTKLWVQIRIQDLGDPVWLELFTFQKRFWEAGCLYIWPRKPFWGRLGYAWEFWAKQVHYHIIWEFWTWSKARSNSQGGNRAKSDPGAGVMPEVFIFQRILHRCCSLIINLSFWKKRRESPCNGHISFHKCNWIIKSSL